MTSPPPSKKAKIDAETERLLTQLLLQRGDALQAQADEQGVLAFCRQPIVRGRLNERYLQNTLKNVFTANKRAQEAALWEMRGLQKQREESSPTPDQVSRRSSGREGHERPSRRDDYHTRHDDRYKRNGQRDYRRDGDSRERSRKDCELDNGRHGDEGIPRRRDDTERGYSRRRDSRKDKRSPSMESDRDKGKEYRRRDDDVASSPSQISEEQGGVAPRINRSRKSGNIDRYDADEPQGHRHVSRSPPQLSRHKSSHNRPSPRHDSPRHVSSTHKQQQSVPSISTEQQSQSPSYSSDHESHDELEQEKHRHSKLDSKSNQRNGQDIHPEDSASDSDAAEKDASGNEDSQTDPEQDDEEGWIMSESELQELLGRPVAKGRGGVGSRADEAGPYLPPGMARPELEGVVRGPAIPPWLQQQQQQQSGLLPAGMLGDPAAAAKQLLAQDRDLAKLLRKVARRKVEEEEEDSGRKERKHKKRKRSSKERSSSSHKNSSSRRDEERDSKRKSSTKEKKHKRRSSDKHSRKRHRSHSASDSLSEADDSGSSDKG